MKPFAKLWIILLLGIIGIEGAKAQPLRICVVNNGYWNGNLERSLCGNILLRDTLYGSTKVSGVQAAPSGSGGFMQPMPDIQDYTVLQRRSYESAPVSGTVFRHCLLSNRRMKVNKKTYDDASSDLLVAKVSQLLEGETCEVVCLTKADLARWYAKATDDKYYYVENRFRKSPQRLCALLSEQYPADFYLILTSAPWQVDLYSTQNAQIAQKPVTGKMSLSFCPEWDMYVSQNNSLCRLEIPAVSEQQQWLSVVSEKELPNLSHWLSSLVEQAASQPVSYIQRNF